MVGGYDGIFDGNGYSYFKLQKYDNFFRDVAVSKSPIMKESAYLFGDGKYRIVWVWARAKEEEWGIRANKSDMGAFNERVLFEFDLHDSTYK